MQPTQDNTGRNRRWAGLCGALFAGGLMLAGCNDANDRAPPRNFNELIPRFMNAANNGTPEQAAINLFDVTSPDERRDAIAYLETKKYGHEPPYMRAYEMLTTDPHPMVKAQALRALGTSYQPEAVPYLVKGLADPSPQVRRDAAIALSLAFGDEAISPLVQHLHDDADEQVRLNSARALARATTPEAVRALIDAMDDTDTGVVYYARQSLVGITHQDFAYDSRAWLTWYQQMYNAPRPASQPAG